MTFRGVAHPSTGSAIVLSNCTTPNWPISTCLSFVKGIRSGSRYFEGSTNNKWFRNCLKGVTKIKKKILITYKTKNYPKVGTALTLDPPLYTAMCILIIGILNFKNWHPFRIPFPEKGPLSHTSSLKKGPFSHTSGLKNISSIPV